MGTLPTHIKYGDCLISEEVSLPFNKHFVEAGRLFEKESKGTLHIDDDCVCTTNYAVLFTFQPFLSSSCI